MDDAHERAVSVSAATPAPRLWLKVVCGVMWRPRSCVVAGAGVRSLHKYEDVTHVSHSPLLSDYRHRLGLGLWTLLSLALSGLSALSLSCLERTCTALHLEAPR